MTNALLTIFYISIPFVFAIVLAFGLATLAVTSYGRFGVGMVVIMTTYALDVLSMSAPILHVGVTLFVADVPMMLIGAVALARWIARPDLPRRQWAWLIFAIVFVLNLGVGLGLHGKTAGVQARDDFYALAAASYAMSFPITRREVRQLIAALIGLAAVLMLVCIYRWTVYYGGFRDLLPRGGTYNVDGAIRVIWSGSALVLGEAFVLGLFFAGLSRGAVTARFMLLLTAASTLVLQHRSVWLAALVGIAGSLMIGRAHRSSRLMQVLMLSGLIALGAVGMLASGALRDQIGASAEQAIEGQGTVAWRFSNWKATLKQWQEAGPRAIVTGREWGSDLKRKVESESGREVQIRVSAHNYYVVALTSYGVIGLLAFLASQVTVGARLFRVSGSKDADAPYAHWLLVILLMQATYYLAYGTDYIQFLLFGVALAFAYGRSQETSDAQAVPVTRNFARVIL